MQISPRYGGEPAIVLDGDPTAIREPFLRQRRRLLDAVLSLDVSELSAASRCEGWRGQDVLVHLASVDAFWRHSIKAGMRGEPTQVLTGFDPVAVPAAIVTSASGASTEQVLEQLSAATGKLCDVVESLPDEAFVATAESPIGHARVSEVLHHALWDAWIHERDILAPLGVSAPELADEVTSSLRYVTGLGAAFGLTQQPSRRGQLVVRAHDPATEFTVTAAGSVRVESGAGRDPALTGPSVELLEALSLRRSLDLSVNDEQAWMIEGLRTVFAS